ncbi:MULTISPECIES: GlxA family transcriptional regulator [Streptomyces]|uniref:AraC-family transcriptional regulator n=1 Tax=Streptomyces coelicolor (strain ATCC BAA-471 / A3(2) / M145) TaxID=100226 RepID=Q9RJN9_STRCO|nr:MULTISPECIES: AraC family transcriptional regulator [Streptomyces]MDX2922967.1 AraC family transcriptional regulator [Streptomyces sp. NRRL_B-16638]MDX3316548.1 AraC family transcriptional regulator [Streptomyces sp. ME03-5684b]MYU40131.1 AraC family transcriptional regulator [Streptomyces sp. SID7813]NSL79666.1 AraC family transcriptional regulator [Streptomyces coelicolor]QFI40864.1 AraC family transcriptional regulator [Streptomyces coelicolor A3(2)]
MHTVAVLALDRVIPFDLSTPIEVFTRTRLPDGRPGYRIRVCAEHPEIDAGAFTLRAPWGLNGLRDADTVIVPGTAAAEPLSPAVREALRTAAGNGTRIASICSGTFPLAATGLLDGLRATTHWTAAKALARAHPEVDVDPDVLYVDNGRILTSAGAAAGLDLCLHMIRRDYGSAVAAHAARLSVMPLEREGGQAQFILHDYPPVPRGSTFEPLLAWLRENLARDLSLADIAAHAGMSTRTLIRRFREQTGSTPLQWLHRARVRQAQHLLETTEHSVERIAAQVGFGSPTAFRDRFKRTTGVSPHAYRRTFG